MAVSAPADRRFRRARVGPARLARPWRSRVWSIAKPGALVLACLVVGYMAVSAVSRSGAFRVVDLRLAGLHRLTAADLEPLTADIRGASIFSVNLDQLRDRLLTSPWVAEASVRRLVPGTIAVTIVEREPVALARFPSGLFLLDGSGSLVDRFGPKYADLDLPMVDGFEVVPRPGLRVEPARAVLATSVLRALSRRPDLLRRLSQVDVSDDHNAVAMLEGDPALLHLGNERFVERLQSYLDMAPALRERVQAIDYIDLRFDQRVYLRPAVARAQPAGRPAPVAEPEPAAEPEPDPGLADDVAPPREPAQ